MIVGHPHSNRVSMRNQLTKNTSIHIAVLGLRTFPIVHSAHSAHCDTCNSSDCNYAINARCICPSSRVVTNSQLRKNLSFARILTDLILSNFSSRDLLAEDTVHRYSRHLDIQPVQLSQVQRGSLELALSEVGLQALGWHFILPLLPGVVRHKVVCQKQGLDGSQVRLIA